jgi:hypothetical protein
MPMATGLSPAGQRERQDRLGATTDFRGVQRPFFFSRRRILGPCLSTGQWRDGRAYLPIPPQTAAGWGGGIACHRTYYPS